MLDLCCGRVEGKTLMQGGKRLTEGLEVEGGRSTDWKELRPFCMFTFFMHFTLRGKLLSLLQ